MTATTITKDNLYSQPSINIFTILDTRANIADPRDGTGARKFVYDSDPFQKAFDFAGMPYIICEDGILALPEDKSANAKVQNLNWLQKITIRTVKGGSSDTRTDAGITDMRTIMNSLIKTINTTSIKGTLRGYNQFNVEINITNTTPTTINQRVLYETTAEIIYSTRIAVSA